MYRNQFKSWQHLVIKLNDDSSSRRQLPRTYEWAKCHQPIGSRCCTPTIPPNRPSATAAFTASVYGVYRSTWHTAKITSACSIASTSARHSDSVCAIGFSSNWQAGGEILNEKGDQAAFNSDAGVKALEFAKWLVDNGHTPKDAITTELKAETSPLAQGKVAMTFSRSLASLEQSGLSTVSLLVGPPLKDAAQASFGTVGGYARFKTSKHPQVADAWIKWITSADHLKEYLPARNFYSPRRSVTGLYESGTPVAEVEAYLDQMNVGLIHPQSREIMDLIKPHLQSALLGKKEPRAALDAAAKEVNGLLARG